MSSNNKDIPIIGNGIVIDNSLNKNFEYSIYHGCSLQRAIKCNVEWGIVFGEIISNIYSTAQTNIELNDLIRTHIMQDAHWNWFDKACVLNSDEYEWFFCDLDEVTQGVCIIFHPKKSFLQPGNVFYIEYISTAPWNRDIPGITKRFNGVGTILIKHTTRFAVENLNLMPGFNLHSLPQSNTFYEKKGMVLIKENAKDGMEFFEMPSHLAIELIND